VTRVYAGGLSFTNAHGNPSHESGVAIDDLIPELKHLPKRKRRRVTDRAFTRALHPFHYFAMLGAAAFGALVMQLLEKNPPDRPQSAEEVLLALETHSEKHLRHVLPRALPWVLLALALVTIGVLLLRPCACVAR